MYVRISSTSLCKIRRYFQAAVTCLTNLFYLQYLFILQLNQTDWHFYCYDYHRNFKYKHLLSIAHDKSFTEKHKLHYMVHNVAAEYAM